MMAVSQSDAYWGLPVCQALDSVLLHEQLHSMFKIPYMG